MIQYHLYMNEDKRKNPRFSAQARVRIPGAFNGEALLKDISITGCCVESTMHIDAKPGAQFPMQVMCETASKIGNFELQVEVKWIRSGDYSCAVGFAIIASPKGKQFQNYVDYLAYRVPS
jgi:hypothetical protein